MLDQLARRFLMMDRYFDRRVDADRTVHADLVIAGSGVAGLTAALTAREYGLAVVLVSKRTVDQSATRHARFGIAAVLPDQRDAGSALSAHVRDTLAAAHGLDDPVAAEIILREVPAAITTLLRRGVVFDRARVWASGHSTARILRASGDDTGRVVSDALVAAVRRTPRGQQPITVLEWHTAIDAMRAANGSVAGLITLDSTDPCQRGAITVIRAPAVLLATGGTGQLYSATTNPGIATGDGIAIGLRAGACAADLEFVQFHPTCLAGPSWAARVPLATEALRGAGALLVDGGGARVTSDDEEAPGYLLATAISRFLATNRRLRHVLLDARHITETRFRSGFPTVWRACVDAGIDPVRQPIPVRPAAHVHCGGLATTVDGRTGIPGLYAAGEVACTRVHGADCLDGNALAEGLVVGARVIDVILADDRVRGGHGTIRGELPVVLPVAAAVPRAFLHRTMDRYAGPARTRAGLIAARKAFARAVSAATPMPVNTAQRAEDAALSTVARCVLESPVARTESRGCHQRHGEKPRADGRSSFLVGLTASGEPSIVAQPNIRRSA